MVQMNANELADELDKYNKDGMPVLVICQAVTMLRKHAEEIEYWKDKFNKAMKMQEIKPAKYSDEWWKEVKEFNKKAQEK
jgi:hypothetical protein